MSFPQVLTGVAHIGIPTNDLDKTIAFYKKLGFVSALETVNKAAGERVAFLQLGDLMIETYENHRAAEKAGAIDHVALATTDIEAAFAAAKEAGMHLLHSSIQSLPFWENGVRFFMVEGPNLRTLPAFELEEIVRFGNAAGSLTTTKGGAIPAMPSMVEIQNCIASIPLM